MENRTNMEDDRVAILEAQLAQAKLIAEEADKKYEEVLKIKYQRRIFYRNWLGKYNNNSFSCPLMSSNSYHWKISFIYF